MTKRYALYCAPEADSPWGRFGAAWFAQDRVEGIDAATFAALTSAPQRYGFHATLKPPFALAQGASLASLVQALERFCARQTALRLQLRVAELDGFLALVPATADARIDALAAACVRGLDRFRAPPAAAELARRRSAGLSAHEEGLLRRWGYPYVMDRFRFHFSLSGGLRAAPPQAALALRAAADAAAAPLAAEALQLDAVCVFEEPRAGADLRLVHRTPFGHRGRLIYVVGPSGAGKDSLLQWVRERMPAGAGVRLARRTITRPADAGGEDHHAATEAEFDAALARGEFALHWRANGHRYGIGREIAQWLAEGRTVVVNGSREYLPVARAKFPQLEAVHVTAPAQILQTRLARRGRERPQEAAARLARNGAMSGAIGSVALVLANEGPIEVAGERLTAFIAGASAAGDRP